MTDRSAEEIAAHISPVATKLPDELATSRVEACCRLQPTAPGPAIADPVESIPMWSALRRSLNELETDERRLIVESLSMAGLSWGLISLRHIRSTPREAMIDRIQQLELQTADRLGRITILKAFGDTDNPVKEVEDVKTRGDFV